MTDFHQSRIEVMIGAINGSNKVFETPTKYVSGTIKLTWNGQVVDPSDDKKGWSELSDIEIQTTEAPRVGDVLQAFYQEKDITGQLGLDNVVGSPFHPSGLLP